MGDTKHLPDSNPIIPHFPLALPLKIRYNTHIQMDKTFLRMAQGQEGS